MLHFFRLLVSLLVACQDERCDAEETCDGVDQDCDGEVDEGATDASPWHPDADDDGYGDVAVGIFACTPPRGFLADATDCDDADASVHPYVSEAWYDGVDQDCDGWDDDQDGDLYPLADDCDDTDATVHLDCDGGAASDADGDGYSAAVDCDDTDPTVFPGAVETWYDGEDQGCDGGSDQDQDGDGWDADDDCDDTRADVSPVAGETCGNGLDDDCSGLALAQCGEGVLSLEVALLAVLPPAGLAAGGTVAGGVDLDGLGGVDLLYADPDAGALAIVPSGLAGDVSPDALVFLRGLPGVTARQGLAALAPDGVRSGPAIAAALPGLDEEGGAWLISGPFVTGDVSTGAVLMSGEAGGATLDAVAAADLDDDGGLDLVLSAGTASIGVTNGGCAWVFRDAPIESVSMSQADLRVCGEVADAKAGQALAVGGDLDGDGRGDLVLGAPTLTGTGAVWIVPGDSTGTVLLSDVGTPISGVVAEGLAGTSVVTGDLDGDGSTDIVIAAMYALEAYVLSGPTFPSTVAGATSTFTEGETFTAFRPYYVHALGDVDGDERDEIALGAADAVALMADIEPGTWSMDDATTVWVAESTSGQQVGPTVAAAGDYDADGLGDWIVGAPGTSYSDLAWPLLYVVPGRVGR